jgi:four helix bundle protein
MGRGHEDLDVWRTAIDLVDGVYDLSAQLPSTEKFGLVSQMQRAAVSVPANIAEGCGRDSSKDLLRHLSIAQGSLAELRTLLVIIRRRRFANDDALGNLDAFSARVGRMLVGLQRSLRAKLQNESSPKPRKP